MTDRATETIGRLRSHLASVEEAFPGAWAQMARFRRDRDHLGGWPDWCWCPMAAGIAVASHGQPIHTMTLEERLHWAAAGGVVTGLAAWRVGQGIYRFDPTLDRALDATDTSGTVPTEILYRLPEWCVYVLRTVPDPSHGGYGAFVWLEWDTQQHRAELRALLDVVSPDGHPGLQPNILHLGHPTVGEAVEATVTAALRNPAAGEFPFPAAEVAESMRATWEWLLPPLLYLAADDPDIADVDRPDRQPTRTKQTAGAARPTVWDVGYRIATALRAAEAAVEHGPTGPRRGPRPHIRRAHWHTYRVGPGRAETRIRWIHPTVIGGDQVVPTIHDEGTR